MTTHLRRTPGPRPSALHLSPPPSTADGAPLGTLGPDHVALVAAIAAARPLADQAVLHWAGDRLEAGWLVVSGRLLLRQCDRAGHERILGWIKPHMFAAIEPLLAQRPFDVDVVADGRTEVLQFTRAALLDLMQRDTAFTVALTVATSARMCRLIESYMTQSFDGLAEKVRGCLDRQARRSTRAGASGGAVREVRITQAQLAGAVGASRFRVGEELRQLAARGEIVMLRGRIYLMPGGAATAASAS